MAKKRSRLRKKPTRRRRAGSDPNPTAEPRPSAAPEVRELPSGPWGRIEFYETYLEAPDALINQLSLPSQQPVWNFIDFDREAIVDLFRRAELTPAQNKSLSNPDRWRILGRNIRIFPQPETVLSLAPQARARIYAVLRRFEENTAHRYPIVFRGEDELRALPESGLPEPLTRKIAQLCYPDGRIFLFSDFPLLLSQVTHPAFERGLIRILTRTRTLMARLEISPGCDVPGLIAYWSARGRRTECSALIEALAARGMPGHLDIAHLLPTIPRSQLYTYPGMSDVLLNGRAPDGFCSALNFFHSTVLPIYLDSPNRDEMLGKMFRPVQPPFGFGDLILIWRSEEAQPCHAAVYIAGDLVYTKESPGFFSPWVFSRLEDVLHYHIREGNSARIRAFRLAD